MPVMALVAAAIALYIAFRFLKGWQKNRYRFSKQGPPLNSDPATHTDAEIIRSMQAYWARDIDSDYRLFKELELESATEDMDTLKRSWVTDGPLIMNLKRLSSTSPSICLGNL